MVLVIDGRRTQTLPSSIEEFYDCHSSLREQANSFKSQPVQIVEDQDTLFVHQRELAVVSANDPVVSVIGTDDATTCSCLVISDTESGTTGITHLDGCETSKTIDMMISRVTHLSESSCNPVLEAHVVGGFNDDKGMSGKLTKSILHCLNRHPLIVHLKTFCVCGMNTILKNNVSWPVVYGIKYDMKTRTIFPSSWKYRGPEEGLRGCRVFAGSRDFIEVYDTSSQTIAVKPFLFDSGYDRKDLMMILSLPDDFIRKHFSTSPAVEPDHFVSSVRRSFEILASDTNYFPNNQPLVYTFIEGSWKKSSQ